MEDYGQAEIKKIINDFKILFDLNYAIPESRIQETEEGYRFIGKKVTVDLDPKEAFELLLNFKQQEL